MPLHVGPITAPEVEETPTTPEVTVSDAPRATWIAPDGTSVPLTTASLGWRTLADVTHLGAMPVSLVTDDHPRGGVRVRGVRRRPREIDWPLRIYGSDHAEFLVNYRYIVDKFTQTDIYGAGTLIVERPDGSQRQIDAYYAQGLEGQPRSWRAETAVITLLCETPWWLGPADLSLVRTETTAPGDFLDPYPNVGSSRTLGATTLTNPGDITTYPEWTITGPASAITISNDTTGESFEIDPNFDGHGDLLTGETVTISTDPMEIIGPDGSEIWTGALNWPGAVLFGLRPGVNEITMTLVDAVADETSVTCTFRPRYRTA